MGSRYLARAFACLAVALSIVACGGGGGGGDGSAPRGTAPTFAVEPQDVSIDEGNALTLVAVANGTGPFSYQWRKGGVDLPGQTADKLQVGQVSIDDDGALFSIKVSNAVGSAVSRDAKLTVVSVAPTIELTPRGAGVAEGDAVRFEVTTSHPSRVQYQWWRDGRKLEGQTGTSYTIAKTTSLDHGARIVVVASTPGGETRKEAALLVDSTRRARVLAGQLGGTGNTDGWNAAARFSAISQICVDIGGVVNIGDGSSVRQLGRIGVYTDTWRLPYLRTLTGIACHQGERYLMTNSALYKIDPFGFWTLLAGDPVFGFDADGAGAAARFNEARGIAMTPGGDILVAQGNSVRRVTSDGTVTTWAGARNEPGAADGPLADARFQGLRSVAIAGDGTVYLGGTTIRVISPTGQVSTMSENGSALVFANGVAGMAVDDQGSLHVLSDREIHVFGKAGAHTSKPMDVCIPDHVAGVGGLAFDQDRNLWIAGGTSLCRRSPTGQLDVVAGTEARSGATDGSGSSSLFWEPRHILAMADGSVLVAGSNQGIRRVAPDGRVTTSGAILSSPERPADDTLRLKFGRIASADRGGVYFTFLQAIYRLDADGTVHHVAGDARSNGSADGHGAAARFGEAPLPIAAGAANSLYVADWSNCKLRRVTADGSVTTIADTSALCFEARGVAVDAAGNAYIARSCDIVKVAVDSSLSGLAGRAGDCGVPADAAGLEAQFRSIQAMTIDAAGTLYVADKSSVRKVTPSGDVTTIVGWPERVGFGGSDTNTVLGDIKGIALSGKRLLLTMDQAVIEVAL